MLRPGHRGAVDHWARRGSGGRVELHERSQFVRDGGAWLYTTGEILD
ncbi:hypothetical protein [Helcobacillus massiliensis]|uniref:Uncharacterized protein YchJ n=1 Tax=Helcobacillus massiliensis TaxID=521392 RepID=A0A839QVN0_9MICO|nr:hypothetical protein [Helcobacillus massiliensis]MBB3022061.1 uncharacterized protein YchJ [Helcobacillus massiliensis]